MLSAVPKFPGRSAGASLKRRIRAIVSAVASQFPGRSAGASLKPDGRIVRDHVVGVPRLLFEGVTSLSKVFGAIGRFSEDIDLAANYTLLEFMGDHDRNSYSGVGDANLDDHLCPGSPQVEAERQSLITIEKRLKLEEVRDTVRVEQAQNARAERASGAILAVGKHPGIEVGLGHSRKLLLKASRADQVAQRISRGEIGRRTMWMPADRTNDRVRA